MISRLAIAAAWMIAFSLPASATLQIAFANGGSTFFCADQTACDLDGAAKNLLLLNTVVGSIKIEGTFAVSTATPGELSVSNLTITNLSASPQTLDMAVGDTAFIGPATFVRSSASLTFLNDNGGSGSLSFWADPADAQPAVTAFDLPGLMQFTTAASISTSPDSFAGTRDSPFTAISPFSMAEGAVLTLAPDASITGFNQSMVTGVPETRSWAMLAIGFIMLGWVRWRKRPLIKRFA